MIIKVLMAQRKESYEGEHAPEALEVMTEFDFSENERWLLDKMDAQLKEKHWESVKIIDVEINGKELMNILRPTPKPLEGKIKNADS